MNKLPLRPNVCIILTNQENKIFIAERNGEPGVWQFPQGGIEPELSLEQNVIKELKEEIGAQQEYLKLIKKLKTTNEYEFTVIPDYAKNKWRGQSQVFYLVEFLGSDSDINLQAEGPDLQEFMDWRWCTKAEVEKLADKQRLAAYSRVLGEI